MINYFIVQAVILEFLLELIGQTHLGRRDKSDGAIELSQRIRQRVHRSHAHITDGQPLQSINAAFLAPDRIKIGQDLSRVFAPTVAAVDDRNARPLGGFVRGALLEVAHHDHIAVELQHLDRVLDRLLIEVTGTGVFGIRETGHVSAQTMHRAFMGKTCARGRLVEGCYQSLLLEQIHVLSGPRDGFHFQGDVEHLEKLIALEILQRQNITTCKTTHTNLLND